MRHILLQSVSKKKRNPLSFEILQEIIRFESILGIPSESTTCLIDLLAILQKSLDRALFLYIFINEARSSGVRASITIVHIRKFYRMLQNIVRF